MSSALAESISFDISDRLNSTLRRLQASYQIHYQNLKKRIKKMLI